MPDFLQDSGLAIYVSLAVALAVWVGIFAYLWRLDRHLRELRRKLDREPRAEQPASRVTIETRKGHAETLNAER
jgi:CcmD family protein